VTERLTFTVAELATALGVGGQTVYDAIARGEIRHVRIGRRIVIPRDVLTDLGIGASQGAAPGALLRPAQLDAHSTAFPFSRPRDSQTTGAAS
jgi:excisionase family DNA binding protein